ncbi:DUF669 domain-containing protein [Alkalihalophilus marmarensis]|uniref:DUF669 domain-containing protein n=1 Tax=Alkalihalophilus marmarensis DSM 21297 TaxID=1188261 RepID=U6SMC9_9BACI|nr:DUF669 domain-containing protein [Alkalihalophilus marmarensis]ERN52849.1 hypothetical protein A33I_14265 [Alkalihalophilus marmarensis DSM 21297]MCM3489101.1 DUF669 domain-containing protein [Alkalihalophilus marmarensis]
MFKIDHSKGEYFEKVVPGEYEATPVNYEQKTSSNGTQMIVFDYEIRSDVEQAAKGQKLLYDNFVVSDNPWRFQQASKAAKLPNGKQYGSYKEWADEFLNKPVRLIVGEREYNGKTYPEVKGFKESQVGQANQGPTISDADVPF